MDPDICQSWLNVQTFSMGRARVPTSTSLGTINNQKLLFIQQEAEHFAVGQMNAKRIQKEKLRCPLDPFCADLRFCEVFCLRLKEKSVLNRLMTQDLSMWTLNHQTRLKCTEEAPCEPFWCCVHFDPVCRHSLQLISPREVSVSPE